MRQQFVFFKSPGVLQIVNKKTLKKDLLAEKNSGELWLSAHSIFITPVLVLFLER